MPGYSPGLSVTQEDGTTALTFRPLDAAGGTVLRCWGWGTAVDVIECGIIVGVAVTTATVVTFYRSRSAYTLVPTQTIGTVTLASTDPVDQAVRRYVSLYSFLNPGEALYCALTTADTGTGSRGMPYAMVAPHEIGSTAVGTVTKPYSNGSGSIRTVSA